MVFSSHSHRALRMSAFASTMRAAAVRRTDEVRVCRSNVRTDWAVVKVADGLLRLDEVLPAGQSFRWLNLGKVQWSGNEVSSCSETSIGDSSHDFIRDGLYSEWCGVISDAPVLLRQSVDHSPWTISTGFIPSDSGNGPCDREGSGVSGATEERTRLPPTPAFVYLQVSDLADEERVNRIRELADYLRAEVNLTEAYERFCASDAAFRAAHERHPGCRILRQRPTETVFGFICSSNNNIRRNEGMMTRLASLYGTLVGEHEGHKLYSFPSAETLAARADEAELRAASFGYRAKFIVGTAKALVERAQKDGCSTEEYLLSLRTRTLADVEEELCAFPGIGRKVAGCIALMSLDCHGAIPVDTHVWKIAKKYMPNLNSKTLTPRIYNEIGDWFRAKYGEADAGLAHNTLFLEELSDFKPGKSSSRSATKRKKRRSREVKEEDSELESNAGKKPRSTRVKKEDKVEKFGSVTVCKEEEVEVKPEAVPAPNLESPKTHDTFANVRRRKRAVTRREKLKDDADKQRVGEKN